mmetsp:Transcript_114435/g.328750  ORF Transcript_114435/g.328750 Transcript_114435/m.328750 type:complete len:249 (-) Transcript_114435:757-1503(-)
MARIVSDRASPTRPCRKRAKSLSMEDGKASMSNIVKAGGGVGSSEPWVDPANSKGATCCTKDSAAGVLSERTAAPRPIAKIPRALLAQILTSSCPQRRRRLDARAPSSSSRPLLSSKSCSSPSSARLSTSAVKASFVRPTKPWSSSCSCKPKPNRCASTGTHGRSPTPNGGPALRRNSATIICWAAWPKGRKPNSGSWTKIGSSPAAGNVRSKSARMPMAHNRCIIDVDLAKSPTKPSAPSTKVMTSL